MQKHKDSGSQILNDVIQSLKQNKEILKEFLYYFKKRNSVDYYNFSSKGKWFKILKNQDKNMKEKTI
jgi:hypothetical protein